MSPPIADLRSDTLTQPTPGMRVAMAGAVVGDEQRREDPTVLELEARVAGLLGHEDAVLVPSATMANQIALRLLSEPGDEVLAAADSHVFLHELGGPAVHSGLSMKPLAALDGLFGSAELLAAFSPPSSASVRSRVLSIENTHTEGGGRVWPLVRLNEVLDAARTLGLGLHLDGARLMNAVVATKLPATEYARRYDTVTFCLTKGLGCPVGALLAGGRDLVNRARRLKRLFGGAMRQAGVLAAAGIYALDHHVERLAEDHAHARLLADGLVRAGLPVDPDAVDTNIVFLHVGRHGMTAHAAQARLRANGVLLSLAARPETLRAVTYHGITAVDIDRAVAACARALLGSRPGRGPHAPAPIQPGISGS